MTFQKLSISDPDGVREMSRVATAIVREHYDPILGTTQTDYMLEKFQSPAAIRGQLEHHYRYFFIREEGRDLGFVAFYPRENAMYLSKLYLRSEERGRGRARGIIDFVAGHARALGLGAIELNVNRFNRTVAIYEKLGFRRIREEKNDIGSGFFMDDFVYRLELAE